MGEQWLGAGGEKGWDLGVFMDIGDRAFKWPLAGPCLSSRSPRSLARGGNWGSSEGESVVM